MNEYVPIKMLKKKSCIEKYPNNVYVPTYVTTYECICGKGELIEENTVGFDDHFVMLKCPVCEEKYRSYVGIVGNDFVLYEK